MASMIPNGWSYEGPDESVGIFGEAFYHEACTLPTDEDATQEWVSFDRLEVTCRGCGASITLEQPEPPEMGDL